MLSEDFPQKTIQYRANDIKYSLKTIMDAAKSIIRLTVHSAKSALLSLDCNSLLSEFQSCLLSMTSPKNFVESIWAKSFTELRLVWKLQNYLFPA